MEMLLLLVSMRNIWEKQKQESLHEIQFPLCICNNYREHLSPCRVCELKYRIIMTLWGLLCQPSSASVVVGSNSALSNDQWHILLFDSKETTFEFGSFRTISAYFFDNYIIILVADHHFEVLHMPNSWLDQKIKHKTQFFLFPFYFNFGRKNHKNLWLINGHFLTFVVPITWKSFINLRSRQSFWGA